MFKHMAESIKETSKKRFISQADKDKYDGYNDRFRAKNDTYSKEELQGFMDEFNVTYTSFEGEYCSIPNTKHGFTKKLEIMGKTHQKQEEIVIYPELINGGIYPDGTEDNSEETLTTGKRTNFISIQYSDTVGYFNGNNRRASNVFIYDMNKNLISYNETVQKDIVIPYNAKYIRFYTNLSNIDNINIRINRTHLDDITSVEGDITIKTCGKNLCDGIYKEGIYLSTGEHHIPVEENICTVNIIKVKPNTLYTTHCDRENYTARMVLYDKDMNCLGREYSGSIVTPKNAAYMHLYGELCTILQLEEGERTELERYQSALITVNTPYNLEGLEEYKDRLFKRHDGVWCIEKRIKKFNTSEIIKLNLHDVIGDSTIYRFTFSTSLNNLPTPAAENAPIISNKLKRISVGDWQERRHGKGIYCGRYDIGFGLPCDDIPTYNTVEEQLEAIADYLRSQKIDIYYPIENPEIIELHGMTDFEAETFEKITHIHGYSNGLDVLLKGEVPVTIGAVVDSQTGAINTLLDEIESLEKMESNINTTMESEYGMVSLSKTNNGYVSDILLEGKTLVNLYRHVHRVDTPNVVGEFDGDFNVIFKSTDTYTGSIAPSNMVFLPVDKLVTGKTYTLLFDMREYSGEITVAEHYKVVNGSRAVNIAKVQHDSTKRSAIVFTMPDMSSEDHNKSLSIRIPNNIPLEIRELVFRNIMLFEGDIHKYTTSVPFKGLKSVGDSLYHISYQGVGKTQQSYDFYYNDICQDVIIHNKSDKTIHYATKYVANNTFVSNVEIGPYESVKVNTKDANIAIYAIFLHSSKGWDINKKYNHEDIYEIDFLNGISVTSANNGNLIPKDINYVSGQYLLWRTGAVADLEGYTYTDFIRLNDVSKIRLIQCNRNICFYREDKSFIPPKTSIFNTEGRDSDFTVVVPTDAKYIRVTIPEYSIDKKLYGIYDVSSENMDKDKVMKSNKQKILYKDKDGKYRTPILRAVPGAIDTIEKHEDGKYYYHKRCGALKVDGDTGVRWRLEEVPAHQQYNIYRMCTTFRSLANRRAGIVSDKYLLKTDYTVNENTGEGIFGSFNGTTLYIDILKSKINDTDIENGFKQYMNENPTEIVYKAGEEEIYECSPIDVLSFEDETNISVHSDTVRPTIKATVRNDLNSVIELLSDKLDLLEETIANDSVYENRVLLSSTYSTDLIGLKSEIAMMSKSYGECLEDYDLYTLISNIILSGKENYDVLYMEEVIDFYTMIGKISYEMADELLSMLFTIDEEEIMPIHE